MISLSWDTRPLENTLPLPQSEYIGRCRMMASDKGERTWSLMRKMGHPTGTVAIGTVGWIRKDDDGYLEVDWEGYPNHSTGNGWMIQKKHVLMLPATERLAWDTRALENEPESGEPPFTRIFFEEVTGDVTWRVGKLFDVSYQTLVSLFGEPEDIDNNDEQRVMWWVENTNPQSRYEYKPLEIYDWKEYDIPIEDVTTWNINGRDYGNADELSDYIQTGRVNPL